MTQDDFRVNIIHFARELIGNSEYSLTARMSDAPKKFNCSSFVKYIFQNNGIYLPRRATEQYLYGKLIPINRARAGCLIFTTGRNGYYQNSPIGHVGIVTELETIIHASSTVKGVKEQDIKDFTEKRKIVGVCSVFFLLPTKRSGIATDLQNEKMSLV